MSEEQTFPEPTDDEKLVFEYIADGVLSIAQASGLDPETVYDLQFAGRPIEIIVMDNGDGTQNVHFEFGQRVEEGEEYGITLTYRETGE